jgi:hypothetical protein
VSVVPGPGSEEVGRNCARIWNTAVTNITEEIIFSVEHDMDIQENILDTLYAGLKGDVMLAGAVYRRGNHIALKLGQGDDGQLTARALNVENEIGYDKWFECDVIGFGCCLVRRNWIVAEDIVFNRIPNPIGFWPAADTILAARAKKKKGMKTMGILLKDGPKHHHGGRWM